MPDGSAPPPAAPRVKFCGLVRPEDAAVAGALGADYVGVIFAGGPRLLDAARARAVVAAAREAGRPRAVGVMGAQSPDEIAALGDEAGLDAVQLHADPDAAAVEAVRARFGGAVWAALRVEGAELPARAAELFDVADAVVLDPKVAGRLGGTGVTLPWAALAPALDALRARGGAALVLAGGLTPENVADAVRVLSPDAVDVSSGVERAPAVKDHARMAAFVAAATGRPAGAGPAVLPTLP